MNKNDLRLLTKTNNADNRAAETMEATHMPCIASTSLLHYLNASSPFWQVQNGCCSRRWVQQLDAVNNKNTILIQDVNQLAYL